MARSADCAEAPPCPARRRTAGNEECLARALAREEWAERRADGLLAAAQGLERRRHRRFEAGKVAWRPGLSMPFGCCLGGVAGVRLTVLKGHAWIQRVVTVTVVVFALLLSFVG